MSEARALQERLRRLAEWERQNRSHYANASLMDKAASTIDSLEASIAEAVKAMEWFVYNDNIEHLLKILERRAAQEWSYEYVREHLASVQALLTKLKNPPSPPQQPKGKQNDKY